MNQVSSAVPPPIGGSDLPEEEAILDRWHCENPECANRIPCVKKRLDRKAMAPRCYRCGSRLAAIAEGSDPDSLPDPNDSPVRQTAVARMPDAAVAAGPADPGRYGPY
ncbi:MAG: hypothetical protein F4Y07_03865 [Gemmatimonadetes bacterium]|nr:hypothetical protein [Gemmatimonadota bacterium]MYB07720.1 hypothetical protein [Gemmatimonadota bacterium]MYE15600.1 hypothetical protein [Gemmatimonadota bacterium]MYG22972.1 hypothetical protein [Gemmatimonadota bacterium]MYJ38846.1 hypothetical protein [Gemmatimonadota bacterium]